LRAPWEHFYDEAVVSVHRMVQTIRSIARDEDARLWHAALGVVTSVYGRDGDSAHSCTVELRETGIVLPRVPIAVGALGFAALPREGDLVLVAFTGGDVHAPFVIGRLYDENVTPPTHAPGELVFSLPGGQDASDQAVRLTVKTPGDGTRSAQLVLDGSVKVELEVSDDGIRLQTQDARLELTQSGSSDAKAELDVGSGRIVLEGNGDVSVEAQGTLTLKATKVEISGDATVKIAGQTIDLN